MHGKYSLENGPDHKPEANLLHLDISKAINRLKWYLVFDFNQTVRFAIDEYSIDNYTHEEIFNQRIDHIETYILLRKEIGGYGNV
jgi:CDP-glucose 4,6-dehydratase